MELNGIYGGVVEANNDPEQLGRLKVRVPHVYGISGSTYGSVSVDNLPWALPFGLPAGGSPDSGGCSWLPEIGDQVLLQFLDGEPEKPVWTWFVQNRAQAKKLKLHHYETKAKGGVGAPDRAIFSRYGHSLEFTETSVTLTTAEGYQILLETSASKAGGSLRIQTPKGQSLRLDDLSETIVAQSLEGAVVSGKQVVLNAPTSTLLKTGRFTVMAGSSTISVQGQTIVVTTASGASIIVDENGNIAISSAGGASLSVENDKVQLGEPKGTGLVIEDGKLSINAPQMVVNTSALSIGTATGWPVLILSPAMLSWLLTHTHISNSPGIVTGPPIPVLASTSVSSQRMRTS
jgi:hypothetical protein